MTLEYPRSEMVLWLKGQRSRLRLGLGTAIRRGFELHKCLLVGIRSSVQSIFVSKLLVAS